MNSVSFLDLKAYLKCVTESETAMIDRDNQEMRQNGTTFLKVLNLKDFETLVRLGIVRNFPGSSSA